MSAARIALVLILGPIHRPRPRTYFWRRPWRRDSPPARQWLGTSQVARFPCLRRKWRYLEHRERCCHRGLRLTYSARALRFSKQHFTASPLVNQPNCEASRIGREIHWSQSTLLTTEIWTCDFLLDMDTGLVYVLDREACCGSLGYWGSLGN